MRTVTIDGSVAIEALQVAPSLREIFLAAETTIWANSGTSRIVRRAAGAETLSPAIISLL